jgi:NAD(P)-dependent dehydrogenase (short-subunit alcohol dehydrogenase family)
MYNPYSLEGKTVLVTGASSGIGRATAIECSKLGAKVVITARHEERLKETLSALEGDGHQLILCEMTSDDDLTTLVETVPVLDGLVCNAGINKLVPIRQLKAEDLNHIFEVNTFSSIILLQKLMKKKKLAEDASVVYTSSISGIGAAAVGESMYIASKGALSAFVKAAALECSKKGIRVNAVCPGMVKTEMSDAYDLNEGDNEDLKNYPLGRYANPVDIAWAIIYLLSNASSWVTGTNLVIDGGLTTR